MKGRPCVRVHYVVMSWRLANSAQLCRYGFLLPDSVRFAASHVSPSLRQSSRRRVKSNTPFANSPFKPRVSNKVASRRDGWIDRRFGSDFPWGTTESRALSVGITIAADRWRSRVFKIHHHLDRTPLPPLHSASTLFPRTAAMN